jgi:hypothetical protein
MSISDRKERFQDSGFDYQIPNKSFPSADGSICGIQYTHSGARSTVENAEKPQFSMRKREKPY